MYPPRDRSQDVYTPPSEFKSAIFLGFLWFGLGAFIAALSQDVGKAWPKWSLALFSWLNAVLIKTGFRRNARLWLLGALALCCLGFWLVWG